MPQKNIDLLLLHPSSNRTVYEGLNDLNLPAIEPPFMTGLIADFIRRNGHSVDIIDANAYNLNNEEVAEAVTDYNPKLVGIIVNGQQPSASSQMMGVVGELCKKIKGRTNVPIVLGGPHPSALPERTLREEECDFVIRGEEHKSLVGLLERDLNSRNFSRVPGLCYLEDERFIINKTAPLADLSEELPKVAWDLLPELKHYRAHNWHAFFEDAKERSPYGAIYTSLGCPFKCSFCMINSPFKANIADNSPDQSEVARDNNESGILKILDDTNPKIRYWNVEDTMRHLDYFAEQGVRHVKFIDEMFVLNKKHIGAIADEIIERGYDFNIWAYARIDTVKDKSLLEKMKKAGFNWLVLGIESANAEIRHGADKKFGNEEIFKHVKQVENAGIEVLGNYMFGLRTDTHETMKQTLEMAKELNTLWFNVYATVAYPGAPDYGWVKNHGFSLPGDPDIPGGWTAYSHHSWYSLPMPTETLSSAEVLKARDNAFHEYFSPENKNYRELVRKKLGDKAIAHLDEMIQYKIPRRLLGDSRPIEIK